MIKNHKSVEVGVRLRFAAFAISTLTLVGPTPQAQQKKETPVVVAGPLLSRTTTRQEKRRLGYGSTVTIIGAPQGSITIEGWPQSEVQITADVELRAETEEDLNLLATVNGWVLDDAPNHLQILSTGTHDKVFMRRVAKKFPKRLFGLPWKIDYRLRVPISTDLEISAGRGPITLSGVEGAITLNAIESDIQMTLTSGTVNATVALGRMNVRIPTRSWRGSGADIRIASGELTVNLQAGFNGEIEAEVLRTGQINDLFSPTELHQPSSSNRLIRTRAGAGGPFFKFTVGDGTIRLRKLEMNDQ